MADGTYFVGRNELLSWINSTLSLGLTKIEQTASGAVACQLMDALHPGSVNLSKVDFNSRSEYDSINNYKALQAAFARAGVDKPVDVARLVKARPLDNIEFMQWFKSYWDSQTGGASDGGIEGYDARARRAASKTGDVRGGGGGGGGNNGAPSSSSHSHSSQEAGAAGAAAAGAGGTASTRGAPLHSAGASFSSRENVIAGGGGGVAGARHPASTPKAAAASASAAAAAAGQRRQRSTTTTTTATTATTEAPSSSSTPNARTATTTIAELTSALAEARLRASAAERERDFYFDKLRDIELLCGAPGLLEDENGRPVPAAEAALKLVERVLFAADEAGAKEVLAEVGVVATGATPPPPTSSSEGALAGEVVATRQ